MHSSIRWLVATWWHATLPRLLVCLMWSCWSSVTASETYLPFMRAAHAHNDYAHTRPLFDALEQGFTSVEADIFLRPEGLLVGHDLRELHPARTLESLYLQPLFERAAKLDGRIYRGGPTFSLMIDVKTDAATTYAALEPLLARYADLLTRTEGDETTVGAVTIVLSGNRARDIIEKQPLRFVGIDGRPADLKTNPSSSLVPWISERWGALFKWNGQGEMPPDELARLKELVATTHQQGRKLRFWATPEQPALWSILRQEGVDFINTDRLQELHDFLQTDR